ncbi:glycoside hydrolase, partial [Auriculariales sp. MPI-PUGE-AT-0066]
WTVYADNWLTVSTFPTAAQIDGYTHFILAFWISDKGPVDNGLSWARMSTTQRRKLKQRLTSGGAKLMIAAGGATDHPTTAGLGPEKRAQLLANYVKRYGFDGVDVNYEDFAAFNANDGRAERWVIRFTRELRKQLPSHEISHGPVAPLFQPNRWGGGGYLRINNEVGGLINFYNIQFYNQGDDIYTSCYQIMERSHPAVPNTSVFQMIRNRVPGEKIVVGKPAGAKDASNGFYSAPALGSCLRKYAGRNGYQGSAMVWQWANAGRAWVHTVR